MGILLDHPGITFLSKLTHTHTNYILIFRFTIQILNFKNTKTLFLPNHVANWPFANESFGHLMAIVKLNLAVRVTISSNIFNK